MHPAARRKLASYIKNINSSDPSRWPSEIYLAGLDLTDADLQPLMSAISTNSAAAQKITKLDLRFNQLTSFSGEGLGALQTLDLGFNQLTSFSGKGLGVLQTLHLDSNQLTSFSGEGLGALQTLDLGLNQLNSFSSEGLGALQTLHLDSNQLTSFSGEGLGALQTLSLNNNGLTSFSGEGLGALQRLALSDNGLTNVCKIMLEAMRNNLQTLNYGHAVNQALTDTMLAEHFSAVLNTAQRELSNTKLWLSMMRRIGLPDDMCRMVFECIYGRDYIAAEMAVIKRALPEQADVILDFEKSYKFAKIKEQYKGYINSLCKDSFKDAQSMKTLLTAYKRWGKYTTNLRYLQDNSRLDPKDNPFQLALRN